MTTTMKSGRTARPGWWWKAAWTVAAGLALVVIMRFLWHDGLWPLLLANVLTPYLFVAAWPVAIAAAARRRWRLLAVATASVLFHTRATLIPLLPRTPPPATGRSLRFVSANLLTDNRIPSALVDELVALDADVYFLQELSTRFDEDLERRGFWAHHPYHRRVVREDSFGSAIASRLPLRDLQVFSLTELPEMRAVLSFEGRDVDVLNVHLMPPRNAGYVPLYRAGTAAVMDLVRGLAGRSFILAGDFNATPDSAFLAGMRKMADDSWELAGRGFGATWPNGQVPMPPIRLDHVFLSRDLTAGAISVGVGAGSDHRPLIATVARRAPSAE